MATEVFYLRFYQVTAQDGPIAALTYSELLGLALSRSALQGPGISPGPAGAQFLGNQNGDS